MGIGSHFGLSPDKQNNPETKQDFRATLWYQYQCSNSAQSFSQNSQENLNNRHQFLSLYLLYNQKGKSELIIYNIESKKKNSKFISEQQTVNSGTTFTQLPNGELFCYGKSIPESGITLIIDSSYEIRILPSGPPIQWSSALYFNNNVYCFGGLVTHLQFTTLSCKFDLNSNRWKKLTPIPEAQCFCSSVIFNKNILIAAIRCSNIWLYSIEADSFSTISYNFSKDYRKILINVERLYLIEFNSNGMIYESEDEYSWKQISTLCIDHFGSHIYSLYNNEKIYFAMNQWSGRYFEFDLKKKIMIEFEA